MSIFSDRVRNLRIEKNLSLRSLAKISGLSSSALHAYEVGVREPTKKSLEALADVLNVDIDYLIGKSDIKNAAANALGYDSLYEAWLNGKLPEEPWLSEEKRKLIDFAKSVPEDKIDLVLRVMQSIVGDV